MKLLNMAGKCFLCMTICDQTCSNGHYYCSEDHLRGHQSADQECYPFEIRESEVCSDIGCENFTLQGMKIEVCKKENKSSSHYIFYPWPGPGQLITINYHQVIFDYF